VVDLMAEQSSYNAQCSFSHILEPLLLTVFPESHKPHSRRLSLHLDNCCIQRSKGSENCFAENSIIRVRRPAYSPDLAASDFWLFGHTRAALVEQRSPGPDDLLTGIQEFLGEIHRSELELVFHHWIERVQWVLDNNGDYFHESTFDGHYPFQFSPDRPAATIYRPPIQNHLKEAEMSRRQVYYWAGGIAQI
jgi:hypothetical protein